MKPARPTATFVRLLSAWLVVLLVAAVCVGTIASPARAHFLLNLNVRIFHVEHLADGLRVFLRMPAPYLLADRVGPAGPDGLPRPAPFTTNRMEEGKPVHYIDPAQLRADPLGLGRLAADGLRLTSDGRRSEARVEGVRVHPVGTEPDFATLKEAKAAMRSGEVYPPGAAPAYVGDSVVDVELRYGAGGPVYAYAISSDLDPGLAGQDETANVILDYGPDGVRLFRVRGLLAEPVAISRSAFSAIVTFVKEGVRHILEGLDHVLFVVCLALGATGLRSLAWRVTGFTLGHSVTLTAGFFGFVPSGAWFIPMVETGIALSIVYAASIAVLPNAGRERSEKSMFFVTCGIGLLHGLGFSFVLHKILQVTSPDVWQSLLAFNVGVEIGQLMIILIAWPLFRLIEHLSRQAWRLSRWGIGGLCAAIATFWTGERVWSLVGTL